MSRIGNKAVEIPDKVKVNVGDGGQVSVEGPKGKMQWTLPREIKATVQDNRVSLVREAETRSAKALHGLSRSLVHNMVQGGSQRGVHEATRNRRRRIQSGCAGIKPQLESWLLASGSISNSQGHQSYGGR